MAKFDIECEQSLGWAHSGEVTAKGKSGVDLTDEEVNVLVNLIREKGTIHHPLKNTLHHSPFTLHQITTLTK